MGDKMRPVPFQELIERIFSEYRNHKTIFGISKDNFYKNGGHSIDVFGQKCSTALGPAAGPHTQLAQNIISSYLVGGRFIELKTVQIMDYLGEKNMIAKPCIDAFDECHNVEWSSEFTLEKAYDEYLKAYFAIYLIPALFSGKKEKADFAFNMSVGYNLEGIKQPKMQTYINSMIDANTNPLFEEYKNQLDAMISEGEFYAGTDLEENVKALEGLTSRINPNISPSVCVSTMHGCPPEEIEAICTYMIKEKHLNTFVKLNPTLLGYDRVRSILDSMGFEHIGLKKESFEHDLQFSDAVIMLHKLVDLAKKEGLGFGVKLTNTLANVNDGSVLPGDERYMSGRSLMPCSITVAAMLSEEFGGNLPISYSGGASAFNIKDLFDTGIRPITLATDMLKPGGYSRMGNLAEILDKQSKEWERKTIDPVAVRKLADNSAKQPWTQKEFRGNGRAKVDDELPIFNCYVSPCMQACPIGQNIPDYINLVGEGRYAEALAVIYENNALPNITCNICDHKCQSHCARMDYEGPVQIRQMKKIAVEQGSEAYMRSWEAPEEPANVKAAVVGAGPAGLSAAYFLARSGFNTSIFEKAPNAGGVVMNIIPSFRIDPKAVQADIDHVAAHGVKFYYNVKKDDVTVEALRKAGFDYIYYAVGAELDNPIQIEGDTSKVLGSLEFLEAFKNNKIELGKHVVVTGGGNTAMDCARSAKRCNGVEDVCVVYRRSENEMPADPEEFEMAKNDGITFCFLSNPKKLENGHLVCAKMTLGESDSSNRRRPIETSEFFEIACDNLITAIGEHADCDSITWYGVPCNEKHWPEVNPKTNETEIENVFAIGDMASGPSTVVQCIASARKAVEATIDRVLEEMEAEEYDDDECCECGHEHHEDTCHCGHHCHEDGCHCEDGCDCDDDCDCEEIDDEAYVEAEDSFFRDIQKKKTHICLNAQKKCKDFEKFAKQESSRCMDCTYYCNKCVDVCPNRANVAVDMRFSENTDDPFQILHIDAFCNECGNCATFCHHNGKPYRDKFTLFNRPEDFENSSNNGFYVEGDEITVRLMGSIKQCRINGEGKIVGDIPELVRDFIEQVFVCYDYLLTRVEE